MYRLFTLFFLLFSSIAFQACDIKDNKAEPTLSFTKIYDNNNFSTSYFPTDIKQTADSGYVILGSTPSDDSNFYGVYLLKIGKDGKFEWETTSADFVNPVSDLIAVGTDLQFFCMGKTDLKPYFVKAAKDLQAGAAFNDSLIYPLAASAINGGFLLETYNRENKSTNFVRLSSGGGVVWGKSFPVFEDVEERIYKHLTHQERPFPFFVGEAASGQYFFNGFNNFTLSMTFTDGSGKQTGVINGERYTGAAMSNGLLLSNGKLATSHYQGDGGNIFSPQSTINTSSISAVKDVDGNQLPEINTFGRIIIKKGVVNAKNVVFYGSDTKNGQIVLLAYDETTGDLLGSRYLGVSNAFELGGFTLTTDGGMAIAGKTYVTGRFPRICVFKLTAEEVNTIIGQATGK